MDSRKRKSREKRVGELREGRNFVFTLNNPEGLLDFDDLFNRFAIRYIVYQEETAPDTGTHHFQGYLELTTNKSPKYVRSIIEGAHFENRKGTPEEARAYAMKEDSRVAGPYEKGLFQGKKKKGPTDVEKAYALIKKGTTEEELHDTAPGLYYRHWRGLTRAMNLAPPPERDIVVQYIYGAPGVGKSRFVSATYKDSVYWKPPDCQWFDNYQSQEVIILDDWNARWMSWSTLMRVLDRYPLQLAVKGGFVNAKYKAVVITTNYLPGQTYNPKRFPISALTRRVTEWVYIPEVGSEPISTESYEEFLNVASACLPMPDANDTSNTDSEYFIPLSN